MDIGHYGGRRRGGRQCGVGQAHTDHAGAAAGRLRGATNAAGVESRMGRQRLMYSLRMMGVVEAETERQNIKKYI